MPEIITEEESVFLSQHIASAMGPKTGVFSPPPTDEIITPAYGARMIRQFSLFKQRKELSDTPNP